MLTYSLRFVFFAAMLGHAFQSQALPLLSENAAKRVSEILTLYPDSQDPKKFYYFPNSSVLAQDAGGRPLFSLA